MKHIYLLLLATILCLFPVGSAAASEFGDKVEGMAEVTAVRFSKSEDKVRIVIEADAPVTFKKLVLSNPDRVVVDIPNAWLSPKVRKEEDIGGRFVGRLRVGQHDKNTVRVVVETKVGSANYKVFEMGSGSESGRIVMDFGNIGPGTAQARIDFTAEDDEEEEDRDTEEVLLPDKDSRQKPEPESRSTSETKRVEDEMAGVRPEAEKADNKKPADRNAVRLSDTPSGRIFEGKGSGSGELDNITSLKGKKICLDPGHGGSDSGAIGPSGVMEKNVTLKIAMELKDLLVKEGAIVVMTRTQDTEVSPKRADATDIDELQARCDVANAHGADIFISIHMDSFTNGEAKGTTGYYYTQGSAKSRLLADKVRQGVIDQINTTSRGTQTCNFYVVKHTDMPATLVEVAFISNRNEERILNSKAGIMKAAQGIADGISDYFG